MTKLIRKIFEIERSLKPYTSVFRSAESVERRKGRRYTEKYDHVGTIENLDALMSQRLPRSQFLILNNNFSKSTLSEIFNYYVEQLGRRAKSDALTVVISLADLLNDGINKIRFSNSSELKELKDFIKTIYQFGELYLGVMASLVNKVIISIIV